MAARAMSLDSVVERLVPNVLRKAERAPLAPALDLPAIAPIEIERRPAPRCGRNEFDTRRCPESAA